MPKRDKPEPMLIESFADLQLLTRVLPGESFTNLVGQKIRMQIKRKDENDGQPC